jgi:hypothetical protein
MQHAAIRRTRRQVGKLHCAARKTIGATLFTCLSLVAGGCHFGQNRGVCILDPAEAAKPQGDATEQQGGGIERLDKSTAAVIVRNATDFPISLVDDDGIGRGNIAPTRSIAFTLGEPGTRSLFAYASSAMGFSSRICNAQNCLGIVQVRFDAACVYYVELRSVVEQDTTFGADNSTQSYQCNGVAFRPTNSQRAGELHEMAIVKLDRNATPLKGTGQEVLGYGKRQIARGRSLQTLMLSGSHCQKMAHSPAQTP